MPAYMTSNNIVPTSQVQIENGFYDFQSSLEDKLLSNSDVRPGYRQVSYGLYESQPDIFVMRPGMGGIIPSGSVRPPSMYAVSQSGNEFNFIDLVNYEPVALAQSDNLLNYIRGGNHPEIIPGRLDLLLPTRGENPEAAYSLVNAELGSGRYSPAASSPNILESFQNIKMRDSGVPEVGYGVETVFNDVLFSPMTNDKAPGGQAQFQNIIMRHGGVVQANNLLRVNSIPQYPMIFDYDNQDQPHSYSPVNFATFDEDSNNLSTGVGNEGNHIAPISYSKEPSRLYAPPFHLTENNGGSNILGQISHDPLLLDDGSAYATGNNPYGQISQNEEAQFQDNLKEAIIQQAL
jgi:hypothetical protein